MTNEPTDEEVSLAVDQFLDSVKKDYIGGANLLSSDWIDGAIAEDPKTGKEYLIVRFKAPADYVSEDGEELPELNLAFEEEAALKLLHMVDYLGHKLWGGDDDESE